MIDPVSAFALAQGAIKGVRALTALYKEAKQAGKEVSDIASEVSGHVGKFMEGTEKLQKAEIESRVAPPDPTKSIQAQAFENIMRRHELQKMETELREMLIYELDMPGVWKEFNAERHRLTVELEERTAKELKERRIKEARQSKRIEAIKIKAAISIAVFLWFVVFSTLMYGLYLDAKDRKLLDKFDRAQFEYLWINDPEYVDCWVIYKSYSKLPDFCRKD
jgi:ABC-type multidrug transport system fused ATPase/permease subunit